VKGVKIPHPCGDPTLPPQIDETLRHSIVATALKALATEVEATTVFDVEIADS